MNKNPDALQYKILRELVTEYQANPTEVIFTKILKRTDNLVLSSIHKHLRRRKELKDIDFEDLYYVGIWGLGRAITTALPKEPGHKITARIVAYVRATIDREYPNYKKKKWSNLTSFGEEEEFLFFSRNKFVEAKDIEKEVESSLLRDKLKDLISKGLITEEELGVVCDRAIKGKSLCNIGKERKKSFIWAKETYDNTIEKLKKELRGWGKDECEEEDNKYYKRVYELRDNKLKKQS